MIFATKSHGFIASCDFTSCHCRTSPREGFPTLQNGTVRGWQRPYPDHPSMKLQSLLTACINHKIPVTKLKKYEVYAWNRVNLQHLRFSHLQPRPVIRIPAPYEDAQRPPAGHLLTGHGTTEVRLPRASQRGRVRHCVGLRHRCALGCGPGQDGLQAPRPRPWPRPRPGGSKDTSGNLVEYERTQQKYLSYKLYK